MIDVIACLNLPAVRGTGSSRLAGVQRRVPSPGNARLAVALTSSPRWRPLAGLGAPLLLDLQRKAGNRAVGSLLPQPSPETSAAGETAVQRHEVEDCVSPGHPPNEVHAAHGRARTMLSIAEVDSRNSHDPIVGSLARKYFRIALPPTTNRDKILWYGRVRRVLESMESGISEATYECEPSQSILEGGCKKGAIAVALFNIHLCPGWWKFAPEDRAFVFLHEWAHKFGTSVNRIFETYCSDLDFWKLSSGNLVAEPDAYASFIFELVTGSTPALC